ncbi:MAG: hypothetical protein Devi2KO_40710 [Devosia indica]
MHFQSVFFLGWGEVEGSPIFRQSRNIIRDGAPKKKGRGRGYNFEKVEKHNMSKFCNVKKKSKQTSGFCLFFVGKGLPKLETGHGSLFEKEKKLKLKMDVKVKE